MLQSDREVTDFAEDVRVEMITTTEHRIPYATVAEHVAQAGAPEAKVA